MIKGKRGKAGLANKNTRVLCASWRSVKKRVKSASSSDDEKIRVQMCVWKEILCVYVCVLACVPRLAFQKAYCLFFSFFPFRFSLCIFAFNVIYLPPVPAASSAFAASLLLCLCNPSSVSQCAFVVNFFVVFASLFSTFFLHTHCVSARCVCVCVQLVM